MASLSLSFYILAVFFILFVIFLYGPILTIGILSFQGPQGGLTFPMNGLSLYWFRDLFEQQAVGDIWGSFRRSLILGLAVMVTTVVVSVLGGLAFRKRFKGSNILFYLTVTSLVIPSILVSLGVGLMFDQLGFTVHWSSSGFDLDRTKASRNSKKLADKTIATTSTKRLIGAILKKRIMAAIARLMTTKA